MTAWTLKTFDIQHARVGGIGREFSYGGKSSPTNFSEMQSMVASDFGASDVPNPAWKGSISYSFYFCILFNSRTHLKTKNVA